jgi:putative membrane protein
MSTDGKHHGAERARDKIEDAAGAVLGKVSAALGGAGASSFLKNAALSDLYAIEAGKIAKRRARTRMVQGLADKLLASHMLSRQLLFAALGRSELADEEKLPPKTLDVRRNTMIEHLNKAPDEHFDATYLDQQLAAHDEAHALAETYATNGDDPHLKAHAMSVLPSLETHARSIRAVERAREQSRA